MHSRTIQLLAFIVPALLSLAASAQQMPDVSPAAPVESGDTRPAPAAKPPLTQAEIEEQQRMAITAYESGEYLKFVQATMRLRNARPYEPQYMVGMVIGSSLVGRQKSAYSYMHKMQQQGLSYDFNQTADTESIRGTEVYEYLNTLLVKAAEPFGIGKTAFELPKARFYPETLAWDAASNRYLAGTLEGGTIYAISEGGKVSKLLSSNKDNGLRGIYGLAVDAGRKRLWVSTTATPAFGKLEEGELGKTALLEFDLESLELLNRFEPPADRFPHLLGTIGLTPEGDVFVMDRAVPLVYIKPAEADNMALFVSNFQLTGLRDLSISDDGKLMYLADAALGVLVINLDNNSVNMLLGPETLNLGGISGIDWARGSLFVLQNGITPQRLMRLDLDATGANVLNVFPLASGLELYDFPSFARVQGDDVFYFAGSNLAGEREQKFVPLILRSPVEPAEGMETPEERLIKERNLKGVRQ